MTGGVTSPTKTLNEHAAMLFDVSAAVHVTDVVVSGKTAPDAGEQVGDPDARATLSATNGALYVTTAVLLPAGGVVPMSAGQMMVGGIVSLTTTLNEHDDDSRALSTAVHVTSVVDAPANWLSVGGLQARELMPELSLAVAA